MCLMCAAANGQNGKFMIPDDGSALMMEGTNEEKCSKSPFTVCAPRTSYVGGKRDQNCFAFIIHFILYDYFCMLLASSAFFTRSGRTNWVDRNGQKFHTHTHTHTRIPAPKTRKSKIRNELEKKRKKRKVKYENKK